MPARSRQAWLVALIATGLAGCTHGSPPPAPAGVRSVPTAPATAETIDGGSYYVLVERADPSRSSVSVHVVQLFRGAAAARQCARDGVPDQHGSLCHAYYIRDRGSRLWTVPIGARADIAGGCGPVRPTTLRAVAAGLGQHRLFRLDVDHGVGTVLTETCTP